MAIDLITGKPGGGKGLYSMKLIIEELVMGTRPVITNLAIRMEPWVNGSGVPQMGLKAYLKARYGRTFNVEKRVFILDETQVPAFFRFRVENGELIECEVTKDPNTEKLNQFDTDRAVQAGGVMYMIDEAWKYWSSRGWRDTGEMFLFYGAQHRKVGDDVLIATQHAKQLDTAIRQIAQNFIVLRNHSKARFGCFRQPDMFTSTTFGETPSPTALVQCRSVFKLDSRGIGGCYDTSAGVGVTGRGSADMGKKRKGLSLVWIAPAAAVGAALLLGVPHFASKFYFGKLKPEPQVKMSVKTNALPPSTVAPVVPALVPAPVVTQQVVRPQMANPGVHLEHPITPLKEDDEVSITGLLRNPRTQEISVALSDGSMYKATDPEVRLVTEKFIVIENRVYRWPKHTGQEPVKTPRTLSGLAVTQPKVTGGNSRPVVVRPGF